MFWLLFSSRSFSGRIRTQTRMPASSSSACVDDSVALPPPPETFPYGIYAVPEISTVGQSEEQVRASGGGQTPNELLLELERQMVEAER